MSKEINKQAVELTKAFYKAIDKKVTPAIMKQGIGQFKSLLNVYTLEEMTSVIQYIAEGHLRNVYSPGYLSYATNKILDDIKLKSIKQNVTKEIKSLNVELENQKKKQKSVFFDKFV